MTVHVRIPQALAGDAGGTCELMVDLLPGSTLGDLIVKVREEYPALARRLSDETGELRRFVNVYVGEHESRSLQGLATPLPAGALVLVAGSVAGG